MKLKTIVLSVLGIVLLGGVVWGVRMGIKEEGDIKKVEVTTANTASSSSTKQGGDLSGITYSLIPKATSTALADLPKGVAIPSLNRTVTIPRDFDAKTATEARQNIEKLSKLLTENPANGSWWGALGMARKGIEDYEGAKEAYAYALKLQPKNAVFADNLGVLYSDYLKDPQNAERYFLSALELEPQVSYRYLRLYSFYTDVQKDSVKAKALLERGLKLIPGEPTLTSLLES